MNRTVTDIRDAFINELVSAGDIASGVIDNISTRDAEYKAVIVAGADTDEVARLDALSGDEKENLPLAGVPILIKDNIETREWPTTAGSLALAANLTGRDADHVARLRSAGALIVGKTNLSEWANFRAERSISGWSAVGGQTGNAHDTARSPCGSSSGSAVAVALGYVPAAIGSETNGSIVCPASVNGVVGFKPTHGLVSGEGIVPIAATQDTAGPFANNVADAAAVLAEMIAEPERHAELVEGLRNPERDSLTSVRIGVIASSLGYDRRRDDLILTAMAHYRKLGVDFIEGLHLEHYDGFRKDTFDVLLYEFKRELNRYLAGLPGEANELTLEKLIEFNERHAAEELRFFNQDIFIQSQELALSEEGYRRKLEAIRAATRDHGLDLLFTEHKLDALIGITGGPAWMIDSINGDTFFGPSLSTYPAIAGNPHITVPMGDIRGMPVGLSLVGRRFEDHNLAAIARAYER